MTLPERRQADRRAAALTEWRSLGRLAERRKAIRRATLSTLQANWCARFDAARATL